MFSIFKAIKKDSTTRNGGKESDLHDFLRKGGEKNEADKEPTSTNRATEDGHTDIKSFRDAFRASEYGLIIRDLDKEKKELAKSQLAFTENNVAPREVETIEPQSREALNAPETSRAAENSSMLSRSSSSQRSHEGADSGKPLPKTPGIGETERASSNDLEQKEMSEGAHEQRTENYATGMGPSGAGSMAHPGLTENDVEDGQDWSRTEATENPMPPPGNDNAELDSNQQFRDGNTVFERTEVVPLTTNINAADDAIHSEGGPEDSSEWEPRNLDDDWKRNTRLDDTGTDAQPTMDNPYGLQLDDTHDQVNVKKADFGEQDENEMERERGEDDQGYSEGEISDEPDAQYDETNYSEMGNDDQQADETLDDASYIEGNGSRYEDDDQYQAFDESLNEDDTLNREIDDHYAEEESFDDTMQEDESLQGDKVEEGREEEKKEEGEEGEEENEGLGEDSNLQATANLTADQEERENEDTDERDEILDEEAFPREEGQDDEDYSQKGEGLEDLDEARSDLGSNAGSQHNTEEAVAEKPLSIPGRNWTEAHLEAFRVHVRPKSNIFDFLARKGVPNRERVSGVVADALKLCLKDSTALRGKTHATIFMEAGSTPLGSFLAILALTVQSTMNTSKNEKTTKTAEKKVEDKEQESVSTPSEHDEWDDFDELDDDESPCAQLEPLQTAPGAITSDDDSNIKPRRLAVATNIMVVLFLQAILESSRALMSGPEKAYLEWTFIPQELIINSGPAICKDENDGALHEKKSKLTATHDVKWEDVNPLEYISIGSQPMYSKHHYLDSDNVKAQQVAHMISMLCERLRSSDKALSEFDRTTFAITSCATSVSFSYAVFTNEYIKHYQLEKGLPSTLTPEMEEIVITSEPELKVFESMPYDLSKWDEALEAGELALALVEFLQKNGPLLAPIEGVEDPSPDSEDSSKHAKSSSRASSAFGNSGKRFPIKIRPQRPAVPAASHEDVKIKDEAESMPDDGPSTALEEDEEKVLEQDADGKETNVDESIEEKDLDDTKTLEEDEILDEEVVKGPVVEGVLGEDDMGKDRITEEDEGLDGNNDEERQPKGEDSENGIAETGKEELIDQDGLASEIEEILEEGSAHTDTDHPDALSPSNTPDTSLLDEEPAEQDDQASLYDEEQYTPTGTHEDDDDNINGDIGDDEYFSGEDDYLSGEDDAGDRDIVDDEAYETQPRIQEIVDDGYLTSEDDAEKHRFEEDNEADDIPGQDGMNGRYMSGGANAQHEYLSDEGLPEHQYLSEDGDQFENDYVSGDENYDPRYAFRDDDLENGYESVAGRNEVTDQSFVAGEEDVENDYPPNAYDEDSYLSGDDFKRGRHENNSDDATEVDVDEQNYSEHGFDPRDELEHKVQYDITDDTKQADITEVEYASEGYFSDEASDVSYDEEYSAQDGEDGFAPKNLEHGRVEEIDASGDYLSQQEDAEYSDDGYEGSLQGDALSTNLHHVGDGNDEANESDDRRGLEAAYEELPDVAFNESDPMHANHFPAENHDQFQEGDDIKVLPRSHHESAGSPSQAFQFGFQTHDQDAGQDQDYCSDEEELEPQSVEYEDEVDLQQHPAKAAHLSVIPEEEDDDDHQDENMDHSTTTHPQSHHQEPEPEYDAHHTIDGKDGYADAQSEAAHEDEAYDAATEPRYGDPVEGYHFDPHTNQYYPLDEHGQPFIPEEESEQQSGEEERYLADDPHAEAEAGIATADAAVVDTAAADSSSRKGAVDLGVGAYDGAGYGDDYEDEDEDEDDEYLQDRTYASSAHPYQAPQHMGAQHRDVARGGAVRAAAMAA